MKHPLLQSLGLARFAACDDGAANNGDVAKDGVRDEGGKLSAVSDLVGKKYILDVGSAGPCTRRNRRNRPELSPVRMG